MNLLNLKSGSKGNCSFLYNEDTLIVIDFGMKKKELNSALLTLNKTLDDINYILLTHNHSDHLSGMRFIDFTKVHTIDGAFELFNKDNYIKYNKEYIVNSISFKAFKTFHDAPFSSGYIFKDLKSNETLGFVTDTGYLSIDSLKLLKNLNYYYFESNYDEYYLISSNRTDLLKSRIVSSKTGHLSNSLSSLYLSELVGKNTKKILLAHLSEECNTHDTALDCLKDSLKKNNKDNLNIEIKCLYQNEFTFLKGDNDD